MPFKDKRKRALYMRMYRQFRKWQLDELRKALKEGRAEDAEKILNITPNISIKRSAW